MPIETTPRFPFFRFGPALVAAVMGLGAVLAGQNALAQDQPIEAGVWFDDTGDGAVEIYACGKNRLCGRIVWLKSPLNAEGKPLFDRFNPDPSLRTRQICGLTILRDLQLMTNGTYDNGYVYDPKKGAEHEAAIRLLSQDKLQLTGFGLGRLLSKSFVWKRAPADIQLCNAPVKAPTQGATAPAPLGVTKPANAAVPVPAVPATKPSAPAQAKTDPSQPAAAQKKMPAQQAPSPAAPAQAATKSNQSPQAPAKPAAAGNSTTKPAGTVAPGTGAAATKPKLQQADPAQGQGQIQGQGQAAKPVTQVKKTQPAAAGTSAAGGAPVAKPTTAKAQTGTAAPPDNAATDKTAAKKKAPVVPAPQDIPDDGAATVAPVKKQQPVAGASAAGATPSVP